MFSLNDGLLYDRLNNPQLIAFIEKQRLVDLWTGDNSVTSLGSVHLAKVTGGLEQHNRLTGQLLDGTAVSWPARGSAKQEEGRLALVTVMAAARENKPLQAVAGIELAGQYVTLRWQGMGKSQLQFSRKLRPSAQLDLQREKITAACHEAGLLDEGFILIIRRSAFTSDGVISAALFETVIAEAEQMIMHWQSNADMPADLRVETEARAIYAGQSLEDKLRQNERKRAASLITDQDWR